MIEALYRRLRTTKPEPGHKVYPYLLRGAAITRPNQVWAMDIPTSRWRVALSTWPWFSRRGPAAPVHVHNSSSRSCFSSAVWSERAKASPLRIAELIGLDIAIHSANAANRNAPGSYLPERRRRGKRQASTSVLPRAVPHAGVLDVLTPPTVRASFSLMRGCPRYRIERKMPHPTPVQPDFHCPPPPVLVLVPQ